MFPTLNQSEQPKHEESETAMGLMDNLKGKAEELREKASELAGKHNEKIDEMVEKTGQAVDKATKHKYTDKIEHGTAKAKDAVDGFAAKPKDEGQPPAN
ncbi:antitoxin [Kitasatospora sp. GP82]|uniref:antitoxin n=1 Tax=Kitasatospora sp. GP82 TaxID=3035089 RepID=UPI002474625E|nr:antitoxin [Kitasatospora sp. GP82]MDH6127714.1 ATP-dependent protease ClpP protease subunit [Kitasatospora sp. GP82]